MERLKMESIDMTQKNIEMIGALFPNVITEMRDEDGNLKKGINFELLKQELSNDVVDGEECYDFTWVGKKAAIVEGNTPIRKTLRPCIEESKDWENTGNLYIEGDNLDVLKLLQESYLNSVKMIYIDPPYNTGNDFIYRDNFAIDRDEYNEQIGMLDDDDNRLFQNTETNGRFHSDWCSMLYPRLKHAQNLLTDDGVIFISIDDHEVDNLKKICNEVFGESNFVACIGWHKNYASANDSKNFSNVLDYILVYRKSDLFVRNLLPRTGKQNDLYKYDSNDGKGLWRSDNLSVKTYSESYNYPITNPNTGVQYNPPSGRCWMTNSDTILKWIDEGRVFFGQKGDGAPQLKRYLGEVQQGVVPLTYWSYDDCGHNDEARKEIKYLFEKPPFDTPKPTRLIKRILHLSSSKDSLILDFFSGSSTTAHALMQLNAEDGGNRKFIMVQLPETCREDSEAFKSGYKNICEIGKERIRRAGDKINEEITKSNAQLKIGEEAKPLVDTGFRVLKVDNTNMKDVYYAATEYKQSMLVGLESNIKEDRTDLDLLYGVLLDWGVPLSLNHKIEKIENTTVHFYDFEVVEASSDNCSMLTVNCSLVACFEDKVSESVVREIAKRQPIRVVFRDSSFANSPDKINVEEIFKLHAPNTTVKVI